MFLDQLPDLWKCTWLLKPNIFKLPPPPPLFQDRATRSHGCGSKLNRRGKPQVFVHVSTYQGSILEFRFFEPQPHVSWLGSLILRSQPYRSPVVAQLHLPWPNGCFGIKGTPGVLGRIDGFPWYMIKPPGKPGEPIYFFYQNNKKRTPTVGGQNPAPPSQHWVARPRAPFLLLGAENTLKEKKLNGRNPAPP